MKVILDTNIALDILLKNEGFYHESYEVVKSVIMDKVDAYILTSAVTDIYYILSRGDKAKAKPVLERFLRLLAMREVVPADITEAFRLDMRDFEDAVVAAAANRIGADYIVTRNTKDFKNSPVPAITPQKFLGII